jgi:recombination protein RecT
VEPIPAATVIVARQADAGVEVLMERRAAQSRFAPGFVVFPGGLVAPADRGRAVDWFGDAAEAPRACAVRELYEETGLLLTASGLHRPTGGALGELGFSPPLPEMFPEIARWVAPRFLEVRFDARFYAAEAPPGLEPRADGVETAEVWWAVPSDVLTASNRGDAPLMWPTLVTLEELAERETVADVLALRIEQIPPPEPGDPSAHRRGSWQRPEGRRTGSWRGS